MLWSLKEASRSATEVCFSTCSIRSMNCHRRGTQGKMREELDRPPHGQATRPPLWPSGLPAAGLTVLWKSSIVNSVKPWDTRSSLLLADTALNLQYGQREAGMGSSASRVSLRWSWTSRSPGGRRSPAGPHGAHLPPPSAPMCPYAHPPHLCNSLLSSSSASKWENPKAL